MIIEQFYDKGLAHGSYVIISSGQAAVIDPGRDTEPYLDFAARHKASIKIIIETHPHADFISSHLELARITGATIFVSRLMKANYKHRTFDDGDVLVMGEIKLKALNTPGHSPDSISIVLEDKFGRDYAVFTGDTLFVGDVGRPDLRENTGNVTATRVELAKLMYNSTRNKLMLLSPEAIVYPAHGAGSLCGKNLSPDLQSTIGRELQTNPALKSMSEENFVKQLLEGQPFIPKYFGYNVELNKNGAGSMSENISKIPILKSQEELKSGILIIDTRNEAKFKEGYLENSINIQNGLKFETWLGSIVGPDEKFYLIANSPEQLQEVIIKCAKIGYEVNIVGGYCGAVSSEHILPEKPLNEFLINSGSFTIVDVRNHGEIRQGKIFPAALPIPLPELRERLNEIPVNKPIMVHCAAGYRSAAGASIIKEFLKVDNVYDLGEEIKKFQPA